MASSSKFTRPFSMGYAYAQTQHYRDTEAARTDNKNLLDPFDAIELNEPAAPVEPPATDAQVRYAMSLYAKKMSNVEPEAAESAFRAMGRREISKSIDTMAKMVDAPKPKATTPEVAEGMYRDPATGDIFKVQVAYHGSGRLYAKKLVKLEVPRVKRSKEYSHDFEYAPGAVNRIKPEWRMTKEQAAEWGRLYGACCKCGTILTDERSIAAGIGPICAGSF